jgi:hypothetical protein
VPNRRLPAPWTVEDYGAWFIIRDHNEQPLAYVYCEDEPGRQAIPDSIWVGVGLGGGCQRTARSLQSRRIGDTHSPKLRSRRYRMRTITHGCSSIQLNQAVTCGRSFTWQSKATPTQPGCG